MAGKLFSKFLDYIGIEDSDYEDDSLFNEQDELSYYTDEQPSGSSSNVVNFSGHAKQRGKVVNMPVTGQMKMIVYRPVSYEETQSIIDNLKSRKPIIVNMEDLDIACAQRILDFMSGAVYAVNGSIFKVSRGIFAIAPNNVDIVGNDAEDIFAESY